MSGDRGGARHTVGVPAAALHAAGDRGEGVRTVGLHGEGLHNEGLHEEGVHKVAALDGGYTGMLCAIRLARRTRGRGDVEVMLVTATGRVTARMRGHQAATGQALPEYALADRWTAVVGASPRGGSTPSTRGSGRSTATAPCRTTPSATHSAAPQI